MSTKLGFEELKKIIETDKCAGCGACVLVCPYREVLEYYEGRPMSVGECKNCGVCLRVCPRYTTTSEEIETSLFGRVKKPEEEFGVHREILVARSVDSEILKRCQDGGVATAIINSAIDSGVIDGAIVSGVDPSVPWFPTPVVVIKKRDVINCSGTRYTYSPNLLALGKLISEGPKKKVAFIGTPCQIQAFRLIQKIPLRKFSESVTFTMGLFCSESFTYKGLIIEKIQNEMSIDLREIEKMNIKGNLQLQLTNGKVVEISLNDAKKYAEKKCKYCGDFSAELADISLGGVGLDGRTFTVIRTEQGEKIFNLALESNALEIKPLKEFERALNLLVRLSKIKRRNIT